MQQIFQIYGASGLPSLPYLLTHLLISLIAESLLAGRDYRCRRCIQVLNGAESCSFYRYNYDRKCPTTSQARNTDAQFKSWDINSDSFTNNAV